MFLGGTPANSWDLQCRERRILEGRISPLQVLGICWGGKKISCVLVGWGHREGV